MAYTTANMVDDLVESIGAGSTEQQRHWLREALNGLVRHANFEQLVEIRLDVRRSIGPSNLLNTSSPSTGNPAG